MPIARTRCAASTTTMWKKPCSRPSSSVAECRNTIGPETLARPSTLRGSVIGWRSDGVRPAPGAARLSAGSFGFGAGRTERPIALTTIAVPAAASAPMMPPPTAAETAPAATTAMIGTAAGTTRSSRRRCRR